MQNSLSALEPSSMDSLGHQHRAKKLSPKIALHFKVLFESKAMIPFFKLLPLGLLIKRAYLLRLQKNQGEEEREVEFWTSYNYYCSPKMKEKNEIGESK